MCQLEYSSIISLRWMPELLWGQSDSTVVRALCCKHLGCEFKSESYPSYWDSFPLRITTWPYIQGVISTPANDSTTTTRVTLIYYIFRTADINMLGKYNINYNNNVYLIKHPY